MNWDAVAAFAELGGAVGVIASLAYLATQIRIQNVENRLNAVSNLTTQYNSFLGDLATDNELAARFVKGCEDFDSLDGVELMQFSSHLGRTFRIYEGLHFHFTQMRLDSEIWIGIRASLEAVCSMPGVRSWWVLRRNWYSARFQDFVQPMIDSGDPARLFPFK